MGIEDINFKKTKPVDLLAKLLNGEINIPSRKARKELQKLIEDSISNGDYLLTINSLTIGVHFDCDTTFKNIRRKGLFRYSKFTNRKCIIKNVALELLRISKLLGKLTSNIETYLSSIINLSSILNSYNSLDKFILEEIKRFENKYKDKSLIKTLLSYVDFLFLSNYCPKSNEDLLELSSWTKEEISSSVSYIIFFYTQRRNIETVAKSFVSEEFIKSGEIAKIIVASCFIMNFREYEIFIDHFSYTCKKVNDKLVIQAPVENFEKSIRLGYIRTELQLLNNRVIPENIISIEELVDEINKQDSFKFFKLTESNNYPRYRVEIPEPVFELLVERFIKPDALFKDEIMYLSQVFKEQLLNPSDLESIKVKDDLSLFEFMKIRRVFLLSYILFAKGIYKIEKVDTELLFRSLIPTFSESQLYDFIARLISPEKIDSFLDIVCWEPSLDILFDLQYHSILFLKDHFLIPLSILANSNSIRNLYASEYKQNNTGILSDGSTDPLVNTLIKALREANITCFSQTSIASTDIDVLAIFQNTLFVFECKHNLHPVNVYDLRTTYDYIKKAEVQLDKVVIEFKNGSLVKVLESKYNLELGDVNNIQASIVLSNRLFNGNIFKYPVRNINEIYNMLNIGTIRTESGTYWLWEKKKLTLESLLDYFSLDNELIKLLYDSLSKRTLVYKLCDPIIEFETFYLKYDVFNPIINEFTKKLEKDDSSNIL